MSKVEDPEVDRTMQCEGITTVLDDVQDDSK